VVTDRIGTGYPVAAEPAPVASEDGNGSEVIATCERTFVRTTRLADFGPARVALVTIDLPLDDPTYYATGLESALRMLRAEAPVHFHPTVGLWSVATHAEVQAVSRDPVTFCSGQGVLVADRSRPVSGTDSIIYLDPPTHNLHRRLVSPAFHARVVVGLEALVRELSRSLVRRVPPGEVFDGLDALSVPLPMLVIAELLGVPGEDRDRFKRWSDAMIEGGGDQVSDDILTQAGELYEYFTKIADDRRARPGDDVLSLLVQAEVDGEQLSTEELLGFCLTLLVAGNETTRNLIAGGLLALAQHPDQLARLVDDRSLLPCAVEEMLRWVTPVTGFCRTARCDVELAGQFIEAGDYVLMLYASANRDAAAFGATADRFDVSRQPNNHLSFGFAEHFCLGAGLARLEARVMFDELLARFSTVELAGDADRLPSTLTHGLRALPLVVA
jgi:cytochrome P450